MRIINILVSLGLLLLLLPALDAGPAWGSQPAVLAVEVTGNRHISEETILRAVTRIRLGEPVNEEAIRSDLQAVQDLGYFSVVDAQGEPFLGGIKIVIRVFENPAIQDFRITGLQVADPADIIPYLTQKKGEVFNYVRTLSDLEKAVQDYQDKKGLRLVLLSSDEDIITEDGVVTLHMTEARVGEILVKGLEKTREPVVRRELSLQEGEILDLNILRQDLQRLYRLQLFADIRPRLDFTSSAEVMDLTLEFQEGDTTGLNMGMTYIPEIARLAGNLGIKETNLLGLGQRISLQISSSPGLSYYTEFDFYEPWLDEKQTSLGLSVYSRYDAQLPGKDEGETYEYEYAEKRTGAEITLGRPLTQDLRVNTSLQLEKVTFDPVLDPENPLPLAYEEYWNNSVGLGLVYNKLIYKGFHTTAGYWAGASTSVYGGYLGGKYDYNKYSAEFKQFYSPWELTTFGYRVKAGIIKGDSPTTSRFYLGGPLSVRGYGDRHVEGTELLLANVELRQRMPDNDALAFVLFYDVGTIDYEEYYHSYGVGLRYTIPYLGKIRFDYGWNPHEQSPRFHFFIEEMF